MNTHGRQLRIGVIGLGVGEQHIAAYRRIRDCRVTLLCDVSPEKLATAKRKYKGIALTDNSERALTSPEVDVVSIASFDEAHFDHVKAALNAGKHVFVEKPLCRSLDEVAALRELWLRQRGRLKLASNLVLRSAPLYAWLRKKVHSGYFGDIYAIDGDYLYGRLEKITKGWRTGTPDYSVMLGGGIHMIDLMLWITGQKPSHVIAAGNRISSEKTSFRYSDYVAATLRFPTSLVGRITANFGCVHRHHHALRIFGTKKTFIYDDAGPRMHVTRDPLKKAERIALNPLPKTKGELIPDFIRSILTGRDTEKETEMIFDGIRIAATSDLSVKTKQEELINYL